MKTLLKKIRIWLGLPEETKWWDEDPIYVIRGTDLLDVLNHRMAAQ